MGPDKDRINDMAKSESVFINTLMERIQTVIVGQRYLVERLLIGLLGNGHILVEGVPGLAKTLSIKTLSDSVNAKFQRIQFTPDLLPADLVGTLVYNPKEGTFTTKKGPIFANIILADEINRAPAKVQSALLEAMQERQVTIGDTTFKLDDPFLVMATQNPIEQEGTYPLPEAQVDRFMLKVNVTYPTPEEEAVIATRMAHPSKRIVVEPVVSAEDVIRARNVVDQIYLDEKLKSYIIDIVFATRFPEKYNIPELKNLIEWAASPRATINLIIASKAYAFIQGRGYVTPEDIRAIGYDVLRHRVIPSYEAEAEEKSSVDLIKIIFDKIRIP
ncbi:MAG: MoxR family ATPase [Candidatus Omnitrophota bacterium]